MKLVGIGVLVIAQALLPAPVSSLLFCFSLLQLLWFKLYYLGPFISLIKKS